MRHLTPADYRRMPWANGRGTTVEMLREDGPDGLQPPPLDGKRRRGRAILAVSRHREEPDGDFRPRLPADGRRRAGLPHAGPRRLSRRCDGPRRTGGVPSDDFNVMTARALPRPEVQVLHGSARLAAGRRLFLLALNVVSVNGRPVGRHDLFLPDGESQIEGEGTTMIVRLMSA